MTNVEKVSEFLDKAKVFSFLTIDEGKPVGRPFGFHILYDGKLYFGCGTFKNVFKQLSSNPNVQIMAVSGQNFMRYSGKAKVVPKDEKLLEEVRKVLPEIMKTYDKNGWEMGMFYLEDGHAELRDIFNCIEEYDV